MLLVAVCETHFVACLFTCFEPVTAGAFGAHALKARLPPQKVESWMTAAHYATINGVAVRRSKALRKQDVG